MTGMKIGDLARAAGLRASAIRYYEAAGILPPAFRESGQRRFTSETRLQLAVIEGARAAGFSIAEIKALFHGFGSGTPASRRWRKLARKKLDDIQHLQARLEMMQNLLSESMRCRCLDLEDCGRILLQQSWKRRTARRARLLRP